MGSSMKLMLAGNYVKYVDDFRRAIEGWKSIWGTLTCEAYILPRRFKLMPVQVRQISKQHYRCLMSI